MKILLTPGFFYYGMQDGRGGSLHYLKSCLDTPCFPVPSPTNSLRNALGHFDEKHAFPTADLCLKELDFLHFEIISSCNISPRSFLTLEMNKIVMLKVWRISYHQVFHFISAIITLVDLHRNWLNWCHILILTGNPHLILMDCMIFLSSYLGVTRMTMSTVFFLLHLDSAILYLQNVFL